VHGLRLADPVAPVHGLQVGLRVPVRVVQYDRVRGLEVDAQTARSRTEEEAIQRRRRRVVLFYSFFSELVGRGAVDADVAVAPAREWTLIDGVAAARSHDDAIDATALSATRRDGPDAVRHGSESKQRPPTSS